MKGQLSLGQPSLTHEHLRVRVLTLKDLSQSFIEYLAGSGLDSPERDDQTSKIKNMAARRVFHDAHSGDFITFMTILCQTIL